MPWEPQPQKTNKQYQSARDLQTRERNQGKQEVLITEDGGRSVDYMRLGKAEPHWEFHACLSHSQPRAPCKATGRTASCCCQLPGPLGCLPQKVQPGALWEASDILRMGAAQVGPHPGSPGPAVSPGQLLQSERWQQMGGIAHFYRLSFLN